MSSLGGCFPANNISPSTWLCELYHLAYPWKLLGNPEADRETKDNRVSGLPPWLLPFLALGFYCVEPMRRLGRRGYSWGLALVSSCSESLPAWHQTCWKTGWSYLDPEAGLRALPLSVGGPNSRGFDGA